MSLTSGRYWITPKEKDDMTGHIIRLPKGTKVTDGKVKPPPPRMSVSDKIRQKKSKRVTVKRRTP